MIVGRQSYNVRFWRIEKRADPGVRYRVRWTVDGRRYGKPFVTLALAESFKAQLKTAAGKGEAFDPETGLPQSLVRQSRDVSCYSHAREFMAAAWPNAAAKSRVSILETLSVALPVLTRQLAGRPDPDLLRYALCKGLNQSQYARAPDRAERQALAWLDRASLPVSALDDGALVGDMLDTLARCLDGTAAAPDYFARRRRVMHGSWPTRCARGGLTRTRLARTTCPRAGPRQKSPRKQSIPGRSAAPNCWPACSSTPATPATSAGASICGVLRLHVLRHDAPGQGHQSHQGRMPSTWHRLGEADLLRLQPRGRPRVHRRRTRARGPRPERPRPPGPGTYPRGKSPAGRATFPSRPSS